MNNKINFNHIIFFCNEYSNFEKLKSIKIQILFLILKINKIQRNFRWDQWIHVLTGSLYLINLLNPEPWCVSAKCLSDTMVYILQLVMLWCIFSPLSLTICLTRKKGIEKKNKFEMIFSWCTHSLTVFFWML